MNTGSEVFESPPKKHDLSVSDVLGNFDRLRISALTKAAEMSPAIKEASIGPNSPINKENLCKILDDEPLIENDNKNHDAEESLEEDKIGEELRHSLIMKEYEVKFQENSELVFKSLIQNMVAKRADTMRKYWQKQSEDCERRALELKSRKLQMFKELKENDNLSVLENAKLDEQNTAMINKQTIENMNRILEEQNKATARFASITDSHTKICIAYNEINHLFQTDEHAKKIHEKHLTPINTVVININAILDICRSGNITDKEVKQAEVLAINIENVKAQIYKDIQNEIKQIEARKQEEEKAIQKEIEAKKKAQQELEAKQAQERAAQENQAKVTTQKTPPLFFSKKNYTYYTELKTFLNNYENQFKDFLQDASLKKFRFDCQKAVNTPVNAISSVSGMHMKDKYEKLYKLLKGERVQVFDTYVQANQHPQGLPYVTALLAKKIVRQGDLLVSSNPEAAFPLASVTVALWTQFPEFGKLLEAYFHKECPYLVPMFLPQKQGQTDKEFYLSRGYTYNEEGVVEKQDKYLKRMSGIFRLKCAIWISTPPRFVNSTNPHSLRSAWQWLASFVNLKPEPDICATLLTDFFNVCGAECFKYYGRQFGKIIKLICTDYFKILEKIDEGGPKTRLEVFLQNVMKSGHIPPPTGLLPPNTW